MIEIIGSIAGLLTLLCFAPQIYKTAKTKSTKDFNIWYLILLNSGLLLWVVYGLMKEDPIIYFVNLIALAMAISLLTMKACYK